MVNLPLSDSSMMSNDFASISHAKPYTVEWYNAMRGILGEANCIYLGIYIIPQDFLLSVVIPAYNEEGTIREIVERIWTVPIRKEIIIVDDCSSDGTRDILQDLEKRLTPNEENRIVLEYHEKNRGKGALCGPGLKKRQAM